MRAPPPGETQQLQWIVLAMIVVIVVSAKPHVGIPVGTDPAVAFAVE